MRSGKTAQNCTIIKIASKIAIAAANSPAINSGDRLREITGCGFGLLTVIGTLI
jgi:hypothetical protein